MMWEYLVLTVTSAMLDSDEPFKMSPAGATVGKENLHSTLTDLGAQGWEAFSTTATRPDTPNQIFFKKPKT